MDEAENQINDLEHKKEKKTFNKNSQGKKRKNPKSKDRLRNLWDNFKHSNIYIIGLPEGEEKEQEIANLFEKDKENVPNLTKEIEIQLQEAQSPKQVGPKE